MVATRAQAQQGAQSPLGAAGSYANAARSPPPSAPPSSAAGAAGAARTPPPVTPGSAEFNLGRRPGPGEQQSATKDAAKCLMKLMKLQRDMKFTGEGTDTQAQLKLFKENFETNCIAVEPPEEFLELVTLAELDDEFIENRQYYNSHLYTFLHSTTSRSANHTVRQFSLTKDGHRAWKALHAEYLPQDALSRTALQAKISQFVIDPHADPKSQLDELMRIIDTYERVRGVPLQPVDIEDAIIGALSRSNTTIYDELIHSLNKETLMNLKISVSQVRNMAGSAYRTHKERNQLKTNFPKQPREKLLATIEDKLDENQHGSSGRQQRQEQQHRYRDKRQQSGGSGKQRSKSNPCFICRQSGRGEQHHRASECPLLKHIPKAGSHPHKVATIKTENDEMREDTELNDDDSSSSGSDTESIKQLKSIGMAYCAFPTYSSPQHSDDKMDFIVDSGATVHITNDQSILFDFDPKGAKTVEMANGQLTKTAGTGELAFHAQDTRGDPQLIRIKDVHLVEGKLNLLDMDRMIDIGFDPNFKKRTMTKGGTTFSLLPAVRPATWRVTPIRATAVVNTIRPTRSSRPLTSPSPSRPTRRPATHPTGSSSSPSTARMQPFSARMASSTLTAALTVWDLAKETRKMCAWCSLSRTRTNAIRSPACSTTPIQSTRTRSCTSSSRRLRTTSTSTPRTPRSSSSSPIGPIPTGGSSRATTASSKCTPRAP